MTWWPSLWCPFRKLYAQVGFRFWLSWLVAFLEVFELEVLQAVLVKEVSFEVLLVGVLRRQLEGCRVRVAVRASPLP